MTLSFRVKNLKSTIYDINKYVLILIYIFINKNDIEILYRIYKKIYLINNLKTHILFNNDVIDFKKIILNVKQNKIYIENYDIIIIITN